MAHFLHHVGRFTAHHKWVVLGAWLVLFAGAIGLYHAFGANTSDNVDLPGTGSQQATDLLASAFPPQQNGSNPLVFHTSSGKVTDQKYKQAIQASHSQVVKLSHVDTATSPFSQRGASLISKDGKTAYIPVLLDVGGDDLTEEIAQNVLDAGDPGVQAGMEVAVGGSVGSELSEPDTGSSDAIGLLAAMIILAFTFGSLVAMGMPIVSAVIGLGTGLSLIGLLGHVASVPSIAPTLATMIGLGVGIDYALFLVSRHRNQLRDGMELHDSIARAVGTSGTAIVFAGSTVVIALISLAVAGIPLVTSLGYSSALAVVTAVLAAITLLPAVLSLVGSHLESIRVPAFLRPKPKHPERGFWGAWARAVTGHPWLAVGASALILIPLIIPFLSLDLGQEDIGATPKSTTERQAYDLLAAGFGAGYNGPLLIATQLGTPAKPSSEFEQQMQEAQSLQKQLEQEQKQGKTQQQQLTAQANELERQQAALEQQQAGLEAQQSELEAEQAALEQEARELTEEQVQLQATRDRLQEQQASLTTQLQAIGAESRQLVKEGAKVTKEGTTVVRRLARTRVEERKVEARLRRDPPPAERARLEARLRELQRQEDRLQRELDQVLQQEQALRKQSEALVAEAQTVRSEEISLANRAIGLAADATALAKQAASALQQKQTLQEQAAELQVEAADLQVQAADLETQSANLNTEKTELEGQQQQAQTQEQQAKQLQTELTNELTKAGGDERGTDPRIVKLQDALTDADGVLVVSPPEINDSGKVAVMNVVATTAPADVATADLVQTLRTYTIPQATAGTDVDAFVGGTTATYVDLATAITDRLFLVIAVVVGLGFLVLLAAFRSFVAAAQAAFANILSVSAAFGVLTACFQWGWGTSLIGLDTASGDVPIASYVPLMTFAVLFGLSMDYQVFLLSQIEHYRAEQGEGRQTIAGGLATGARVIVAAALIMMSVFGSFILNGDPTVKQFGVGLSVGVGLAAITVLLLAPALLVLAGAGARWMPGWLDRVLPHVDIEGEGATESAPVEAKPAVETPGAS